MGDGACMAFRQIVSPIATLDREQYQKIKLAFHEAIDLPAAERAAFIAEWFPDASLQQRVHRLLDAHDSAADFIESPAVAHVPDIFDEDPVGQQIGNYKIIRELGRGGMGGVFLAARADTEFDQLAAIKLIKRGMDTDEILRRFRQERQILATLEHPNIARLLDGGTTADGLPFLVMEYVEGVPVTQYCRTNSLDEGSRLEIFRQICSAVEYAHRHLIIHRDIKPSNILVTANGVPKLLDFGIAKLLSAENDQTVTTMRAMTPEYASPEQIRGESVTTATDIYSLGIVLAELAIHRDRQTTSSGADKVHTDLRAVWQTAVRDETELRYRSVEQFSEDIRRYTEGLPVLAQPDSLAYRASKFIKRNRVAVGAAVGISAAAAAGIFSTIRQSRIARLQSVLASRERDKARLEAAKAEKINHFLQEMLGSADPRAQGKDVMVAEVLGVAAERIETDLAEQPEIAADLRTTIGLTYLSLGAFGQAEEQLRASLDIRKTFFGRHSPETAIALKDLGKLLQAKGEIAEAEPLFHEALAIAERTSDDRLIAEILNVLGELYFLKGMHSEAVKAHREAIEIQQEILGQFHPDVAAGLKDLAVVLGTMGRLKESEKMNRKALAILRRLYTNNHPDVAAAITTLASAVEHKDPDEAESLFLEALEMRRNLLGDRHPDVAWTLYNYAYLLYGGGDFAGALQHVNEVLAMRGSVLPQDHILVNSSLQLVGLCLMKQQDAPVAERFLRDCLELRQRTLPKGHWLTASAKSILGECLAVLGEQPEARTCLISGYEELKKVLGADHEQTRKARRRLDEYCR